MEAYITLLTNNNYASGALENDLGVLGLVENLALLGRPELGVTLTKVHVFNQTQYSKVVFLDADTLVLRNIDDLFDFAANGSLDDKDRNTRFAASPDAGWPDCFNSGVFVCRPSFEDYTGLIEMANQEGTFDGGDQGLLNSYFSGWSRGCPNNRLPFVYNTTPSSVYSYAPAFQQYRDRLNVVHFVGSFKPWQWLRFADGAVFPRNTSSKDSIDLVQKWWNIYDKYIGGKAIAVIMVIMVIMVVMAITSQVIRSINGVPQSHHV
ncbi:Glycogenin-1 [Podila clonocystis]|nr:Glycogenin-1 [Podila clonocystis]